MISKEENIILRVFIFNIANIMRMKWDEEIRVHEDGGWVYWMVEWEEIMNLKYYIWNSFSLHQLEK